MVEEGRERSMGESRLRDGNNDRPGATRRQRAQPRVQVPSNGRGGLRAGRDGLYSGEAGSVQRQKWARQEPGSDWHRRAGEVGWARETGKLEGERHAAHPLRQDAG